MARHFLEFTDSFSEQFLVNDNSNVVTPGFNSGQQNHVQQIYDISKQPMVVDVDPLTLGKEQIFGCKTLNLSGLNIINQHLPQSINTAQDPLQSITVNDQDDVGIQDLESKKVLIIQDQGYDSVDDHEGRVASGIETPLCDGKFIQDHVVTEIHDDHAALLQLLGAKETELEFVAVDSDKRRNPPYLVKDARITTKNDEPIKFCLTGAQPCQMVSVTMRYTEEKYKTSPVNPCLMHKMRTEDQQFNFYVSMPTDSDGSCRYDIIHDHPTANLMLNANMMDLNGDFVFCVTMKCLNSCHKESGKKMELIFKLKDPSKDGILQENRFEIRVCKNVKRDYKEACEDYEVVAKKRLKPNADTFITDPVQGTQATSTCQEEANPQQSSTSPVQVHLLSPLVEEPPKPQESKLLVKCMPAKAAEIIKPKFYLIQLPTLEKEKNVLDTVRLYGGKVLDLESVIPEEDDDDNENDL